MKKYEDTNYKKKYYKYKQKYNQKRNYKGFNRGGSAAGDHILYELYEEEWRVGLDTHELHVRTNDENHDVIRRNELHIQELDNGLSICI